MVETLDPFADKLRLTFMDLRIGGELRQQDVADHLSEAEGKPVAQSYVSHVERAGCNVSLHRWEHLATALGKSLEELLFEAMWHGVPLTPEMKQQIDIMRELLWRQFSPDKSASGSSLEP
jgi:hypothetical protein